ncbi:MAG: GNAT family N-acetyltransferase [Patescibacteria group bacterium]|nr:GNAT family N-acetyltransferase [Patescibacteria group bacterium]
MDSIIIRPYKTADKTKIINLWHDLLLDIFNNDPNINEETVENIPEIYGNNFLVADIGNRVIGTIGFLAEGDHARLKRMYIDKKYQGVGVADKLYKKIEKRVRESGLKRIFLSTYPQMQRAISFYFSL